MTTFSTHVARLEHALFESPGASTPEQRREAAQATGHESLGSYARQVEQAASKVTAEQVEALRATLGDDAMFELTICAAHGAAKRRLEAGLAALDAAFGDAR